MRRYAVIIERAEGNQCAWLPDLPDAARLIATLLLIGALIYAWRLWHGT